MYKVDYSGFPTEFRRCPGGYGSAVSRLSERGRCQPWMACTSYNIADKPISHLFNQSCIADFHNSTERQPKSHTNELSHQLQLRYGIPGETIPKCQSFRVFATPGNVSAANQLHPASAHSGKVTHRVKQDSDHDDESFKIVIS